MSNLKEDQDFDPNGPGIAGKLFGLPHSYAQSEVIVIPVPWETTVSYREGTSLGPSSILRESVQVDLFSLRSKHHWKKGIYMLPENDSILEIGRESRGIAREIMAGLEEGVHVENFENASQVIDSACREMIKYVAEKSLQIVKDGKIPVVLGGDHSSPLGLIMTLAKRGPFGILQIDAHADLRNAYQGFKFSHASIMTNVLELDNVSQLVQVGIRDLCDEEYQKINQDPRIYTYFDSDIKKELIEGGTWAGVVERILQKLPDEVYISFDIDGLDPALCPNTGTPVPGGLSFEMVEYLLHQLSISGKKVIGFDLCEVSPGAGAEDGDGDRDRDRDLNNDWDANVGSRVLYKLFECAVNK